MQINKYLFGDNIPPSEIKKGPSFFWKIDPWEKWNCQKSHYESLKRNPIFQ